MIKRKNTVLRILFIVILSAFCLTGLCACKSCGKGGNDDSLSANTPENKNFSLSKSEISMIYGDSAVLIAKNYDVAETVLWTTSDEKVVSVDGGAIKANGTGSAEITATAGGKSAKCNVTVGFGNYQPTLSLGRIDDDLTLVKGENYPLESKILFNGKDYAAESLTVEFADETIAKWENGVIIPLKAGSTEFFVKGEWQGFDTPLMKKTASLKVINGNVEMSVYITENGVKKQTNSAEISVVSEWCGKSYTSAVGLEVEVIDGGVNKTATITIDPKDKNVVYENGELRARGRGIGESHLTATYTDADGEKYSVAINVNVFCPVKVYPEKIIWDNDKFQIADYFGSQANIISVKQGDRIIESEPKKIIGKLSFAGDDTETIEIITTKGGYIFDNIYGYDKALTSDNIVSALTLGSGKKNGFFVLNEDIGSAVSPVDFTMQNDSDEASATYFSGTFLGNGHTVYAKVSRYGMFGGAGSGAVIKDAKFVFTFDENVPQACGFFGDENRQNKDSGRGALLENLYVVTTNFADGRYAIAAHRMLGLKLKDVLVDLGDTFAVKDFDGRKNIAALFKIDYNLSPMFNGSPMQNKLENVRIISGKFIPVANGDAWSDSKSTYLNFAGNDEDKFGNLTRSSSDKSDEVNYSRIIGAEYHDEWRVNIMSALNSFTKCFTMFYGVYRYDTAADLLSDGVNKVGSWTVA